MCLYDVPTMTKKINQLESAINGTDRNEGIKERLTKLESEFLNLKEHMDTKFRPIYWVGGTLGASILVSLVGIFFNLIKC